MGTRLSQSWARAVPLLGVVGARPGDKPHIRMVQDRVGDKDTDVDGNTVKARQGVGPPSEDGSGL